MMLRRPFLASLASLVVLTAMLLVGCGTAPAKPDAQTVAALAPTGTLRVGVYEGSPTSLVLDKDGKKAGVAHDVGQALAQRLGVAVQVVTYSRVAQVLDSLKAGQVDVTFTNASAARQQIYAFTQPLLSLELGYLVPVHGKIQMTADVDQAGHTIGVSQGSSSQAALGGRYQQAKLASFASLDQAKSALLKNEIDGFATNKGILNEMLDSDPSKLKILGGSWGVEHMGIAMAKERAAALPFVQAFGDELKKSGELSRMATRAGLRGFVQE